MLSYHSKQIGAALLIILAIIVLGMTAFLLTRLNNTPLRLEDQAQTALALAEAKAALLGFASTYAENHAGQPQGYLPCPDFNGDGSSPNPWGSDTSCGQQGKSVIGRLPWRTLGLPALRDGSGECLWYAISGSYKDRPKTTLTSDSNGLFYVQNAQGDTIAGTYPSNQAIAIIFSPGKLIGNQDRSLTDTETECGSVKLDDPINNPSNYLDVLNNVSNGLGGDASSGGTFHFDSKLWTTNTALQPSWFVQSQEIRDSGNQANVIFNDTIMVITPNDFTPVYRRMDTWVAARVRDCLEEYAQQSANKYPWLSSIYPADYTEDDEQRFGRIPQAPLTQTNQDNSGMLENWTSNCFDDWNWWEGWRQHIFVAIDEEYAPVNLGNYNLFLDGVDEEEKTKIVIETVIENGVPTQVEVTKKFRIITKAIILVAGRSINKGNLNQVRSPTTQDTLSNYLEDDNADGDSHFVTKGDNFNDVVIKIVEEKEIP